MSEPKSQWTEFKAVSLVFNANLTPLAKLIFLNLVWHANRDGGNYTSLARIMAECGFTSENTARLHINMLITEGLICKTNRPGRTNYYQLMSVENVMLNLDRLSYERSGFQKQIAHGKESQIRTIANEDGSHQDTLTVPILHKEAPNAPED